MKTLARIMAFACAFALAYTPPPVFATVSPTVTVAQAPLNGMTLARSALFETGNAAIESSVEVNSACTSRITLFSIGGSQAPHTPMLSVYAPTCNGSLTVQALIGGTNRILHSSTNLTTGVPEYVTASYDGTTLSMTLNGTVIASQTFTGTLGPVSTASSVGIGRSYDTYSDNFPGVIWGTRIFSAGLTNGQIATDYAAATSSPPYGMHLSVPQGVSGATVTAPIFSSTSSVALGAKNLSGEILADLPSAYYRLNELSGASVNDSSGHNLTAAYSTTPVSGGGPVMAPATGPILVSTEPDYSTFAPDTVVTTAGTLGIEIPDSSAYLRPASALSAEATVMPDAYGDGTGAHIILFAGNASAFPNGAWALGILNGKPYASLDTSGSALTTVTASTIVPANKMVHLAMTFDGSTLKLYVNGGLSNSASISGTIHGYTSDGVQIGADTNGGYHFGGYVSNVAIYSSTLTAARIADHAAAANGFTLPASGDYVTTQPVGTVAPVSRLIGWSNWAGPPNGVTMTSTLWNILASYTSYDDHAPLSSVATEQTYGIYPGFYFDGNQKCTQASSAACNNVDLASSYSESSFAHDCSGNRVYYTSAPTTHNTFTDPRSSTLATDINSIEIDPAVAEGYTFALGGNYNIRSGISTNIGSYTGGAATNPQPYCGYSDSSYLAGSRQTTTQLHLPLAFNGAQVSQIASGVGMSPNSFAAVCEGCFTNSTNSKEYLQNSGTPLWIDRVDSELATGKLGKIFTIRSDGTTYLQTDDMQGYLMASMLIGWSPNVTLSMNGTTPEAMQAAFSPIINLVPQNPVVPLSAIFEANNLRYGDVYVRAYRDCYLYGRNVGKCIAIVNPDQSNTATVPVDFTTGYTHGLTIDNVNDSSCLTDSSPCYKNAISELGDTGRIVESTVTPATTLPPLGWEVLVQ